MATNLELITTAGRLINVIDENEAPSAEQGVAWFAALNDMLADWFADGIRLGWFPQTDLNAEAPLAAENIRGVKFNLALEIAGLTALSVPDRVMATAQASYARLAKGAQQYFESDLSGLPIGDAQYGYGWGFPWP